MTNKAIYPYHERLKLSDTATYAVFSQYSGRSRAGPISR